MDAIERRCSENRVELVVPIEECWYETDRGSEGSRQLVVADPDGYLLRFFVDLGLR